MTSPHVQYVGPSHTQHINAESHDTLEPWQIVLHISAAVGEDPRVAIYPSQTFPGTYLVQTDTFTRRFNTLHEALGCAVEATS